MNNNLEKYKKLDIYKLYDILVKEKELVPLLIREDFFYETEVMETITSCLHPYYYYSIKELISASGLAYDFTVLDRLQKLNERKHIASINENGIFEEIDKVIKNISKNFKEERNYVNTWLDKIPKYLNGSFITVCNEVDELKNTRKKINYKKIDLKLKYLAKIISSEILFDIISHRHFNSSLKQNLDILLETDLIEHKRNKIIINGITKENIDVLNTLYNLNSKNIINKDIYEELFKIDKTEINKCFGIDSKTLVA